MKNKRIFTAIGANYLSSCIPILTKPKQPMKEEYILCAAIHNPDELDIAGEPLIHCGLRHNNILWQGVYVSRNPYHQGFLTNTGRFVDRKEALEIAIKANQVKNKNDSAKKLYSEDLY